MRVLLAALLVIGVVRGEQKCQKDGSGLMKYNGKPCASTTRYDDGHRGACGCGPAASDDPFDWNLGDLVTAPNQEFFDNGGSSTWCGAQCGVCVKLTPTGGYVNGQGVAPSDTNGHIFMVTNDCPREGNEVWCGQSGGGNNYGYGAHFDLQDRNHQVSSGLGWNNPEVTYEVVSCPGDLQSKWSQCECH